MTDSLLSNDGFFILRNDGGQILLNEHADVTGVTIEGTHSSQRLVKQRRTKLVNTEFSFWLIASLIRRVEIKLLQFKDKLQRKGLYSDALRESFKIPVTDLKQKLIKLTKLTMVQDEIKSYIDENLVDYMINKKLYEGFKELIKIWKKMKK